jgi:hypothetical protein
MAAWVVFLYQACALLSVTVALYGCTSVPPGSSAAIPPDPQQDDAYQPVLEKWSQSVRLFDQFQNQVELQAVLFTEEMRQAYLDRWVKMRGDTFAKTGLDVGGKLAVFVSIFTPQEDYLRLDNAALWTVRMSYGAQVIAPVMIRRLFDKALYTSFFPFINTWSSEYLIVFEPSVAESSPTMELPQQVSAQFLSGLASVELQWK